MRGHSDGQHPRGRRRRPRRLRQRPGRVRSRRDDFGDATKAGCWSRQAICHDHRSARNGRPRRRQNLGTMARGEPARGARRQKPQRHLESEMNLEVSLTTKKKTKPPSVRDAVFDLLRELGIDMIFGIPGSTELAFLTPWPADLRYVLALQEASAVATADGYAQATGNAAFVNLHSAAGLGNGLGTLYTAFRNQSPLIVTAGQQTRDLLPYDPYLGAERPTEFPRPYVKWACEPARAEDVPVAIAQAYAIAMERPRGPVFVSIPCDDWGPFCGSRARAPTHLGRGGTR